jgi:type I restriction enzyme R subunit
LNEDLLPSPDDDDEFCRRFDLLILNLQLAILQTNPAQVGYKEKLVSIAKDLEAKSTIPSVAKQLELILDIQTPTWWEGVTLPMLEDVRVRLRALVRFIDPEQAKADVYTNFEDEIGEGAGEYKIVKADQALKDYGWACTWS